MDFNVTGITSDLDSICSELDDLSVHMLYLMKEYIDCKVNIEDLIKTGSLHLAKSRYIMGNRSVSSLQLPTEDSYELTAQTTLFSSQDRSGSLENITLQINRLSLGDLITNKTTEGLKSRSKSEKDQTGTDQRERKNSCQDPLKWFGVLVPQNLRHAQSCFNKAIDSIIQCANIQLEMDTTQKKFENFIARKKKAMLSKKEDNKLKNINVND